ncbi:MAG: DUF4962 domain-containing protein, partial [Gemmatimonadota bacterium]|nr:DUF4962 domain-containing protein [Gemmatimonadota bacterium]
SDEVVRSPATAYCIWRPEQTLSAGHWYWRVLALDKGAASRIYSFSVGERAVQFIAPDFEAMLGRIPEGHPRLLLRPEQLESLSAARLGDLKDDWLFLVERAEAALKMKLEIPDPETEERGTPESTAHWRKNYAIARNTVYAGEVLAFCYMVSGEQRYLEGGRRILNHILSWDPAGPTSIKNNDECGMPVLQYLPRMYDWLYPGLSDQERRAVVENLRIRGSEARARLEDFQHKAYDSHAHRMYHQLAEAGIAMYTEVPEAGEWIRYALNIYHGWYPIWGDVDGGWAAGLSYYSGYTLMLTSWLDAAQAALGLDPGVHPYVRNAGNFAMYLGPGGIFTQGLGDNAERIDPASSRMQPLMETLAYSLRRPEWLYLASKITPSERAGWFEVAPGKSRPQLFIRKARDGVLTASSPKDIPVSKIFHQTGVAVLNTDLADGYNNVQVQFRSSAAGTISHMHADQNAFLISAYGQRLAIQSGFRPWYGSPFCKEFYWNSLSKNTILVNGRGQEDRSLDAVGRIARHAFGKTIDIVEGRAGQAYGDRLKKFSRVIVFVKPDIVLSIDNLLAVEPARFTWQLHALNKIETGEGGSFTTSDSGVTLAGRLLVPKKLKLEVSSGWPLEPEMNPNKVPGQWHLRAESEPAAELMIVAVMQISKGDSKAGTQIEASYSEGTAGGMIGIRTGERVIKILNPAGDVTVEMTGPSGSERLALEPVEP